MSIRNKLIIYTFSSILITLVVIAFTIDLIVRGVYNENAIKELEHSYSNFNDELELIENDIGNHALQIAGDKSIVSLTNMITRYQDKENYARLLFDGDKKKTALFLLKLISVSRAEQASIYDKSGDLIAYAIHNKKSFKAGFISYKNGLPLNYILLNDEANWKQNKLPASINLKIKSLSKETSFLTYAGEINYTSGDNEVVVENNRVISRTLPNGKYFLLGLVKVSKSLNEAFFKKISRRGHGKISLILNSRVELNKCKDPIDFNIIEQNSMLHGAIGTLKNTLLTNKYNYLNSYVWPTENGNNYILISSSRLELISALNKTRVILFISFSITAMLAIILGLVWLNKIISKPLKLLNEKASISDFDALPNFPVGKGNDEISLLGKVLNKMVRTIRNRERQLFENEAQLSHTQNLAKIGGWKVNHKTHEVNYSSEIYNIIELEKSINPPAFDVIVKAIHPEELKSFNEVQNKILSDPIPYDVVHRLVMKDGRIKTVHIYSETTFDDSGIPLMTIGTIQDVSEQALKDEQIRRSQKMDSLGKLTGGIAHDFNNMLGVILGFSELIQGNDKLIEKDKKYIKEVINAANRAGKLTSKLLSFTRKEDRETKIVDLNKVLSDEKIMLEKTLTARIKLKLELANNLWLIKLDENDLGDAIVNMSINAMHAMMSGGELTLTTSNSHLSNIDVANMEIPDGDYVLLSITDTGIGMSQETKQKIFEPFFTTKNNKGTGLGMSQVYGFVKRSFGTIHVYSDLGYGTRITLYFPRYISDETKNNVIEKEVSRTSLMGSETILVVDDEAALRELSSEILLSQGYKVLIAESGAQALEILKVEHVDLVFSDVIMPEMDGYQLSSKINELYPEIKIQITSGFSEIKDFDVLQSELHNNRLQKPFNTHSLLEKIKERLSE